MKRAVRRPASLRRLPSGRQQVALTFDDGPSNETPRLLATLAELGVPATFFVCGSNVDRRPGVARAIVEAGHVIGNHSYSHPRLTLCSRQRVRSEVARTQQAIEVATGTRAGLFRPPYGLGSPFLGAVLREFDLLSVRWDVMGRDWKWAAGRIARRVLSKARAGSIVCLHDGQEARPETDRSQTIDALPGIVARLREQGLEFVTVPGARPRG